jgi:hypothetical protein
MRTHIGWPLALLLLGIGETQLRAQDFYYRPSNTSSDVKPVKYHGSYVRISAGVMRMPGPIMGGPRAVQPTNISTTLQPIIIMPPPSSGDLSGVDLDVVRRMGVSPGRVLERDSEGTTPLKTLPPAEPASLAGIGLSKPKQADSPQPLSTPISAPPSAPPEDRRDPDDPWRLMDLGKAAFANQEYGTAARRFRQVTEVAPNLPLGYFLLAQAELALGKHRLAVRSVEAGLRLKPEWPGVKTFQPRKSLYKGDEAEFDAHLKRLGDVLQEQPQDGDLLFLHAYELWFDGQNAEAATYFARARAVVADPARIDRFLNDGTWKVAIK